MKTKIHLSILAVAGLLTLTGCKSTPQMTNRPDFLSTYTHLQKVETGVWRYISPPLLANCNKFVVDPVQVMFTEVNGQPITPEQRQRSSDFVRAAIIQALTQRYPVVTDKGPETGEIRVALTEAYRSGGKLGLGVEGEILDNSNTQVAAVIRTELSEYYAPGWENKNTAKQMVNEWAERLVKAIDQAHGK